MALVCGTDFSSGSSQAVATATALATRLADRDLWFVHVLDPTLQTLSTEVYVQAQLSAEQRLHDVVREVQDRTGCHAQARVLCGAVSDTLVAFAEERHATALILSSQGHGNSPLYRIGGISERVALLGSVPVLIVREAGPFEAWARGERPLRMLLGVDGTLCSVAPVRWVKTLREAGPCDVCVTHIYYGNDARDRYGLPLRTSLLDPDAEVEALLTRDMAAWVGDMGGTGAVTYRAVRGLGRTGDHVLEVADSERTDVIITGTHQRRGLARLSAVSGVVLHYGHAAVACVPQPQDAVPLPEEIPSIRCVLIPTDLSPLANSAIPYGYAILRDGGGEVWLLHVLPEESRADAQHNRAEVVARLRQLVPAMALQHNIVTRTEVVQSADVARTICDTAERIAAHVICLTSHGRSGFARTLLGSVADAVMTQTRRPLFLLRSLPA